MVRSRTPRGWGSLPGSGKWSAEGDSVLARGRQRERILFPRKPGSWPGLGLTAWIR